MINVLVTYHGEYPIYSDHVQALEISNKNIDVPSSPYFLFCFVVIFYLSFITRYQHDSARSSVRCSFQTIALRFVIKGCCSFHRGIMVLKG